MSRFAAISLILTSLLVSCRADTDASQARAEWLEVLSHKKAAASPDSSPQARQVYADSLAAFVRRHPTHSRARRVYERIQIDFASELSAIGRHQDAIRFYRAVLAHDPANTEAMQGLREATERLAVSREQLLRLEIGMSHHDVVRILGKPIPGWTVTRKRRDATIEGWYYRTGRGGVAGVYFRQGRLFAAEENSHEAVAVLARSGF